MRQFCLRKVKEAERILLRQIFQKEAKALNEKLKSIKFEQ